MRRRKQGWDLLRSLTSLSFAALIALALAASSEAPFVHSGIGRPGGPTQNPQAVKPAPRPALQHEVTVALKLIQVFVTDREGKPALGLDKSDFALTDNGRSQTITDFEPHVLHLAAALPVEAAKPADAAPGAAPVAAPLAEAKAPLLSRKFIILIDCCQNVLEGVAKAKRTALEFLESKTTPDDEVALFTLSPMSGLTLYENLTKDHAKVQGKIKKLRELVGGGSSGGDIPTGDLMGMDLLSASIRAMHVGHAGPTQRNLFGDIAEWAKALRAIPGQKNIILFTMGYGTGAVRPGSLNNVLFEAMARALASANAPVFTVDTSPQALPGRDVQNKLPSGTLPEVSLAYLSETTGGKFLGGVNHSARIAADIHDATANYYVLGYYVPAAWDGKYHEIKVEVRKPGLVVHAQRGYFNPVPFADLSPIEKHIHLLDLALGDEAAGSRTADLPMTALPFVPADAADRAGNVLLLCGLDPDSIRSSVGDRTELITLVLNETSAIADGKRAEIDWRGFGEGKGSLFEYGVSSLPPGRYDCKVVIRNLDDGRAAVGACAVEVEARQAEGPQIFPPLLLLKSGEGHYMNLASADKGGDLPDLSISRIYPFPAREYAPLVGPLASGSREIWALLRCLWREARLGEIELECSLKAAGVDEEIPVPAEIVNASNQVEVDLYLVRLELPALGPGGYELTVRARDAEGSELARTKSPLTVR